jgi:hypothetical protein
MPVTECLIAVQTSDSPPQPISGSGEGYAWYFVLAIVALVLGLVVMMFIRTSIRRSAKRQG